MIEYKVESWAYGTCHYFEDEFVSVAINHYNKWQNAEFEGWKFHVMIAINGELKYNELLNLEDWKAAETFATNKLGELR